MQNTAALFRAAAPAWGLQLRAAARVAAPLVVLIFVIAADLVATTFRAGRGLGGAVHRRNAQLAAAARRLVAPSPAGPAVTLTGPPPPLATPGPHLAPPLEELEALTQRQLMALVGTRRKLAKRQLVAMLAHG